MALTRLFVHDTFYDATDNFTYTPGMRLTLDSTTQSARITRLQNSGVVSTDETIDPSGVAITGGNIDGTVIGATTAAAGTFTTITVDTTTLVTDATNNRVGIGTASPDAALHVNSGATNLVAKFESTDATVVLAMADNTTTTTGNGPNVLVRSGDTTGIYSGGTERVTILGTGAVGIGTTSPSEKLHLIGNARIHGSVLFDTFREIKQASSTAQGVALTGGTSNTTGASISLYGSTNSTQAGNLYLSSGGAASTGSIIFRNYDGTSFNTHMTINSSGNVGIGTTSPSAKLHVSGNARIGGVAANTSEVGLVSTGSNTYAAGIQVRNYDAAGWARVDWYHQSADNPALLYQISNGSLYFRNDSTASTPFLWNVGSTTTMVINSSGNVGIGTQSANRRLTVRSPSANTTVLAVQNNDNTSEMFTITETSAKHGRLNLRDATNTTNVEIQTSGPSYFNGGNVGIGTTSPSHELEVANASSPTIRINDTGGTSTAVSAWIEGAYAGTQAWFVGMNTASAAMTITNYLNGPMTFGTNGIERLRLTSTTGGTGGTGSAGSGNQYVELEIAGSRYKLLHDGTL